MMGREEKKNKTDLEQTRWKQMIIIFFLYLCIVYIYVNMYICVFLDILHTLLSLWLI